MVCIRVGVMALASLCMGAGVVAGPLDPPTGPVSATGPTRIFTLPVTISVPGTYRLGKSLQVVQGMSTAIKITASDVTLDLDGQTLDGTGGSLGGNGIMCSGDRITISNGAVHNWGNSAITSTGSVRLLNLQINGNGNSGPLGSTSVSAGSNSQMIDCVITNTLGLNVAVLGQGAQVSRCIIQNAGDGSGLTVGDFSTVSDTSVRDVSEMGGQGVEFIAGVGCTLARCTAKMGAINTATAFKLDRGSTAFECEVSAISNGYLRAGIVAAADCHVFNCTINGVAPPSGVCTGISAANSGVVIRDCKINVSGISSTGILAPSGGEVRGCVISGAVTGISATGTGATIDGNTVIGCTTGYSVAGASNLVVRNNARGNTTDFTIGAGNTFGPIVNATAGGDLSGIGGSTHPQANFRY